MKAARFSAIAAKLEAGQRGTDIARDIGCSKAYVSLVKRHLSSVTTPVQLPKDVLHELATSSYRLEDESVSAFLARVLIVAARDDLIKAILDN